MFQYADGTPVREGDWVLMEHGSVRARVEVIYDTAEQAAAASLQGRGVVIDADPRGFVFLSEALLAEDPLRFVDDGPDSATRSYAGMALFLALLFLLPALYSLFSAIYSAWSTGEVMVISVGRTEIATEIVPWREGWARFAGPVVLLVSLCCYDGSRGKSWRWWLAAGAALWALDCWPLRCGWLHSTARSVSWR